MKKIKFTATCVAAYKSEIEVPDNLNTKEEVLAYILDHINECPCNELTYLEDTDEPVTIDDFEMDSTEKISATCSICNRTEEYQLNEEETATLKNYRIYGRQIGYIQELFPNIPAWIRSGAIDQYSGGFCICPNCN